MWAAEHLGNLKASRGGARRALDGKRCRYFGPLRGALRECIYIYEMGRKC